MYVCCLILAGSWIGIWQDSRSFRDCRKMKTKHLIVRFFVCCCDVNVVGRSFLFPPELVRSAHALLRCLLSPSIFHVLRNIALHSIFILILIMIQTPDIVLFSLTDNNSNDVFERALRAHLPTAVVLLIRTCDELWETIVFDPAHLPMIIVMDEGILGADVDPSYLQIFPYYLRWGGNLVFAHHFITASKRDIEFLFNDVFDLGWTKGDFFSGKFITNKHALENIPCSETFPEFYSNLGDYKQQTLNTFTRGILIKGARPDERIYM